MIPQPDSGLPASSANPAYFPGRLESDLAFVLDNLQAGVIFLDFAWRITYANKNARRLSYIRDQDIQARTHWEIYPDTVGTELERRYRRVMSSRVEDTYTFHYEPFNLTTSIRITPIATGIALIYRDLTAEMREETEKLSIARQLAQVLEVTTDAVISLDRGYTLTYLNRRARELLAPLGEVLGTNLWQSFPATIYDGLAHVECHRRAMEERIPCKFEGYYQDPLNIWVAVQSVPAEDGIIIFFRDITEERANQAVLARQQAELERQWAEIETVYRTAPVGLALFDPVEFRYLRLNERQAEFFGLPPEQIVGTTLTEMAPIDGLREMFEQVARGEPVHDQLIEGELVTRPGEHRYWTVNYHPVYAPDGSVQAISAVSQEITRQKQAEAALLRSEKLAAVGRLAASISHEINNPLEAITNILYLVGQEEELPGQVRAWVEMAQAEVARVSQIATQTLRFHRQSARQALTDAERLTGAVLGFYKPQLARTGITVETRYGAPTRFLCFENDIRQVLNNLIGNAIDAMRHGGRLIVRARETTDWKRGGKGVRITIADTGHGMDAATRRRIFEPFYTTKDLNGTGLGLWISCEIVERHNGQLIVRSSPEPRHRGTVFALFLPVAGADELKPAGGER